MNRKIVTTLVVLILVILPFLCAIAISPYSPYAETNSFRAYLIISAAVSIASILIVLRLLSYFHGSFEKIPVGGIILFLLLYPLVVIFGLASGPDLSLKMLEHPEREHLRYIMLFVALILFGGFVWWLYTYEALEIRKSTKWILAIILASAFAEYTWEFTHHYLYPEGLKEWVSQGKNAQDFSEHYDNIKTVRNLAVFGRYFQFMVVLWLSFHFYRLKQIKIWCLILNTLFSLLGITSATLVFINGFNFPKGFEFLMLFFIPGIAFFLLYWLGVALLTKFRKSERDS